MAERFISEPIEPEKGAFAAEGMARGEPGVPRRFTWRGKAYDVAEIIEQWKDTRPCRHGSGERYVGRHWVRVRTTSGDVMRLYFERNPRPDRTGGRRWYLYSIEQK